MKFLLLLVSAFIISFCGMAQPPIPNMSHIKDKKEQLRLLSKTCDSLFYIEDYNAALKVARYGLQLTPGNDYYNLSLFNFYIGARYQGIDGDSSIYYLEKSLAYGRRSGKSKRVVNALERLLYMYSNTEGYAKQRDNAAIEVLHIIDTTQNYDFKRQLYNSLATYYEALGLREQQMHIMLTDLELSKKELRSGTSNGTDSANLGVTYITIGALYLDMEQPQKALEYLKPSKVFIYQYRSAIFHYYKDMAEAYLKLSQPGYARLYYDSLTSLTRQEYGAPNDGKNNWDLRMSSDLSFAEYYLVNKKTDSALLYMNIGKTLVGASVTDTIYVTEFNYMMGRTLVAAKEYTAALGYLKSAEKVGRDMGLEQYANVLRELAQCYSGLGQGDMAAVYYAQYLPIRDSLYTTTSQQSLANAEARFQNKDKQQQIEARDFQLSAARKQRLWLIAGLVLAGLVALLLIIIYRNKRRTANVLDENNKALAKLNDELEEANRTKAKLFSIIGHDLRSPINQVYQFLKLQQLNPNALSADQKSTLSAKIQTATGSLLETMEDLLIWSKTQMNTFNVDIREVAILPVIETCRKLLQLNSEAKNIIYQSNVPETLSVKTDSYYLQTIIRNLLQNAIKASPQNGIIAIGSKEEQNKLVVTIANEGGGYTQQEFEAFIVNDENTKSLSGLGLRLVHELSQKIGAKVIFENPSNNTTKVSIMLPLK